MQTGFLVLVLLGASLVAAHVPAGEEAKKDLANLQGNWKVVSVSVQGKMLPEATLKKLKGGSGLGYLCVIKGDKFVSKGDKKLGTRDTVVWTMRPDPAKKPKAIDLLHGAPDEGKTTPGIYSLDGDTLKIYIPDPNSEDQKRPTGFANKPGVLGYVLERQKD